MLEEERKQENINCGKSPHTRSGSVRIDISLLTQPINCETFCPAIRNLVNVCFRAPQRSTRNEAMATVCFATTMATELILYFIPFFPYHMEHILPQAIPRQQVGASMCGMRETAVELGVPHEATFPAESLADPLGAAPTAKFNNTGILVRTKQ